MWDVKSGINLGALQANAFISVATLISCPGIKATRQLGNSYPNFVI